MVKYEPLEDRLIVKPLKKTEEEKTESGIIIPDLVKTPVKEGVVVSIGPGRYAPETGQFIQTSLTKGDRILFGSNQGMEIKVEIEGVKEEVLILRESDVLLLISKK